MTTPQPRLRPFDRIDEPPVVASHDRHITQPTPSGVGHGRTKPPFVDGLGRRANPRTVTMMEFRRSKEVSRVP